MIRKIKEFAIGFITTRIKRFREFLSVYNDKVLHAFTGYLTGDVTATGLYTVNIGSEFAILGPIVVGVTKELWDKFVEKEKFNIWDLFFTIGGGIASIFVFLLSHA